MKKYEKSNSTITTILTCAGQLFRIKGYDATTMQDITQEAQLSKGAVYHHFKSKQEIMNCIIQNQIESINHEISKLTETADISATEKIKQLSTALCNNDNQQFLSQTQWFENNPSVFLESIRNTLTFIKNCVAKIIIQGNEEGNFHTKYPDEVSGVLCILIDIWIDPAVVPMDYDCFSKKSIL